MQSSHMSRQEYDFEVIDITKREGYDPDEDFAQAVMSGREHLLTVMTTRFPGRDYAAVADQIGSMP